MSQKDVRSWKKVFENDLPYVISELKESVTKPAMIILSGEMGVGKTTFAKAFAGDGALQSPTYSVLSETVSVAHADLYRIKDTEEILHLELGLYIENKDYFLVEWGKRYLTSLFREVDERFSSYELLIEINNKNSDHPSRDYVLSKLERN
ncbi:MAG: tRNA (adenosine(37)-N6)-threonylcarbamoyltransferase complex ATPase subunit type 1 TsaE [Oligoflexia bacterium]|nr:tRNA (adenosine(37)-N6)-threonylcarbamoyltransferase complex ATPase subunit type 1 TsaE [Oligoflexia bacterium]MBF0367365.1 tRNA (adenosine(37)-N6)-threonylcarbamoyltransferase complex ATPase subunit type 1 TsaE [Oligoflexia bacterium]